eukprot:5516091-Prymnesium_polylepis.1
MDLIVGWEGGIRLDSAHESPPVNKQHRERSAIIQGGDGPLRNGSRIWEAAHPGCSVAIDCAGDEMDSAAPCCVDTATLQREDEFGSFITLHWGDERRLEKV